MGPEQQLAQQCGGGVLKKSIAGNCDDNELNFIITYCDGNIGMQNIKQAWLRSTFSDGTEVIKERKSCNNDPE